MRSSGFFPTPWYGGPGVIFDGCAPPSSCTYDGGAIELVNTSGAAVTVNSVSVQLNAPGDTTQCIVNIWPANVSLPAGGTLIDAQTASGSGNGCPSGGLFDTSDVGPNGSGWSGNCSPSGVVPQITVTANGSAKTFTDTGPVLTTGEIDLASCPSGTNESLPWTQLTTFAGLIGGGGNPVASQIPTCNAGDPVNCATGNRWETLDELSIPGRGVPLDFSLTYNSLAASQASAVGFGWSSSLSMGVAVNQAAGTATVTEDNGSTVVFNANGSGGWTAPSWAMATLTQNGDGTFTLLDEHRQAQDVFAASGQLLKAIDRNGYTTTFAYQGSRLTTVTDPAGRTFSVTYGSNGDIAGVTDATGRTVALGYDASGNLKTVTDVNGGLTSFTYDGSHLLLTTTVPRGGVVTTTYDGVGRAVKQVDALQRTTTWSYLAGTTTITDPAGNVTREHFSNQVPVAIERGVGTTADATWTYAYDPSVLAINGATDPNGHTTTHTYDTAANLLSTTDPLGRRTTSTYDALNDPLTRTDGTGVTTTNTYDAHGNLLTVSRPLVGSGQTQVTTYTYGDSAHPGDVTAMQDPDGNTSRYTYDAYGDRTTVADPLGDVSTTCYNQVGWTLATYLPPAGSITCAIPPPSSSFETQYSYMDTVSGKTNQDGLVAKVTQPGPRITVSHYDADRNLTSSTDGEGNTITYVFDLANQQTDAQRADGTDTHTDYDLAGRVQDQKDGSGTTIASYGYDSQSRVTAQTDGDGRTTAYAYDGAGNKLSTQDPGGNCAGLPATGCTTYGYDADNELTSITYSDGVTPNATAITYDGDGQRTGMTTSAVTSSWSWDSLHRMTSSTEGSSSVGYGYDLKGQLTSVTYPGSLTVSRTYDAAGNLTKVKDWNGNATTWTYDDNGNATKETLPAATGVVDHFTFNKINEMASATVDQGSTALFSADYTLDNNGAVRSDSSQPPTVSAYQYTALNQVCYAGSNHTAACAAPPTGADVYGYNNADNLTSNLGVTQAFDAADQLCWTVAGSSANTCSSPPTGATSYAYNAQGDRTAVTPTIGAATRLGYDQGNRLTSWAQGSTSATYRYNGAGLRVSKTANGTATAEARDESGSLPLLLQDGSTDYVYGAGGLPLETITGTTTLWLHHDRQGSTRLITNSTGAPVATWTYDPYGNIAAHVGTATAQLLYAGQYQDAESGLYYLRARYYDPATAQFLSRDPAVSVTRSPYGYVGGNPLNMTDPSGRDYDYFFSYGMGYWGPNGALIAAGIFESNPNSVYPFALKGSATSSNLERGQTYDEVVEAGPGAGHSWGPLTVQSLTSTSVTFVGGSGFIGGQGATITFSWAYQGTNLVMTAHAHGPDIWPFSLVVAVLRDTYDQQAWGTFARNLANEMQQIYEDDPAIFFPNSFCGEHLR